jgi:LPXTG-motif cell wall-anchored protein
MRSSPRLVGLFLLVVLVAYPAAAQGPELQVLSPTGQDVIQGSTVTVKFTASGISIVPTTVPVAEAGKRPEMNKTGEGHLHFMLDLQPLVVWEKMDAYTFTNVPPGEHQLMVELVQNDHSPLSPPVVQQIRFRTAMLMPTTGSNESWSLLAAGALMLVALGVLLVAGRKLRRGDLGLGAHH